MLNLNIKVKRILDLSMIFKILVDLIKVAEILLSYTIRIEIPWEYLLNSKASGPQDPDFEAG